MFPVGVGLASDTEPAIWQLSPDNYFVDLDATFSETLDIVVVARDFNLEFFRQWSVLGYPEATQGAIIGIAKDGFPIYAPIKTNGDEWSCIDHDACNGRLFEDGHYGYVSTFEFPYTIGCWGPADDLQFPTNEKTCSPNSCPGVS